MKTSAAASVLALAGAASGQTFIETFDNGVNTGGWRLYPGPPGRLMSSGGYPGWWMRGVTVDPPELRSSGRSAFTGDWTIRGDTVFSLSVLTLEYPLPPELPMTIQLVTDNGTPGDPTDDWGASMPGIMPPPAPEDGWLYASFYVPATSAMNPPACWEYIDLGPAAPATKEWAPLIRHVTEVRVLWSAPGAPGPSGQWIVGIDNVRIEPADFNDDCYADCNRDNRQTVHDFICFQSAFAAAQPYADCNHDNALNVNDFVCFQAAFAAGCSFP
jgi:hypothetical protein